MVADVIIVGGANIDIKCKAVAANLLGTSNPGIVSLTAGGVGRNIAHNLARMGVSVSLLSVLGKDAHGEAVLSATVRAGVGVSLIARSTTQTGTYVAVLDRDGEMVTAISDMRIVEEITPALVRARTHELEAAQFVVADCNLPQDTLLALAALAGNKLVIEPVSVSKSEKLITVLKSGPVFLASPNFDQMDHLAGTRDIAKAFAFLHAMGLQNAMIHAGAEGAFTSDGVTTQHVEALPAGPIIDVTGAGDAAVAGLVYGLLQREPLHVAAARGQVQAGRVIASAASTLE
jgi:pseudouridine kinase